MSDTLMQIPCQYCGYEVGHNKVCVVNEITALKARVAELDGHLDECQTESNRRWELWQKAKSERDKLAAQVEKLTEDEKRLNWLEMATVESGRFRIHLAKFWLGDGKPATIRDAIDHAARLAAGEPE